MGPGGVAWGAEQCMGPRGGTWILEVVHGTWLWCMGPGPLSVASALEGKEIIKIFLVFLS